MASPALSQASTAFETEAPQVPEDQKTPRRPVLQRVGDIATSQDVFLFLIAFRILNALSIRTFFQPDEYFQSLEPAWEIAFGANSGAWITWEWKNQLRSAIHPAIFAGVYRLCAEASSLLQVSPIIRDELFLAAPKVTQAVVAALGDYYTWELGERVYGRGSREAWAALFLTVTSPWQWFCSTRTLSNCLETTLTIVALHHWPWHWSLEAAGNETVDKYGLRPDPGTDQVEEIAKCVPEDVQGVGASHSTAYRLCRCLLLAALACVLRPTNVLIWICLACFTLWQSSASGRLVKLPWINGNLWIHLTSISHGPAIRRERIVLILEAAICGTIVLAASTVADRLYYQQWTFPPFRFLYFNLARSLSVHYGRNPWHYYLTQGYPFLLTTYLPFAVLGLYQSLVPPDPTTSQTLLTTTIKRQLATTSLLIPFTLSFISHKEVRFIYPLLPALHILSADPFSTYFFPLLQPTFPTTKHRITKTAIFTTILAFNLLLALFSTALYQTAPLTTLAYLRSRSLAASSSSLHSTTTTAAFLTPCHSTPWRSHLLHTTLKAWALSCQPPLHLPDPATHANYLDEADQFYASPVHWLSLHLGRPPKSLSEQQARLLALETATGIAWDGVEVDKGRERKKAWTAYLVTFGQLEEEMAKVLKGSGYGICRREWNGVGGWHEDWRRRGGMVVWCLDEGEKKKWRQVEKGKEKERGWADWFGLGRMWGEK